MRLATNLVLACMFVGGLVLSSSGAPVAGWVGSDAVTDRAPVDLAHEHAAATRALGCRPSSDDTGLQDRVVIHEDGRIERLTFDELAHDSGRVWVIGSCPVAHTPNV